MHSLPLWDLPTRLIHWSLIPLLSMLWFSSEVLKSFDVHAYLGLVLIGLLSFRITWGFVGTKYARFSEFLAGKQAVKQYLQGTWQGLGHNPIGGWSALLMLSLLVLVTITGLFAHHHEDFYAPFAQFVSHDVSRFFNQTHKLLFNLLLIVVGVHVLSILFYRRILNKDLVTPMLTGKVETDLQEHARDDVRPWAVLLSTINGLLMIYFASGIWLQ